MNSLVNRRKVLVLNKSWNPCSVVSLRRALILLVKGDAEIVEVKFMEDEMSIRNITWADWTDLIPHEEEDKIRTSRKKLKCPEIIVLHDYNKLPTQRLNFSRRALYRRDNNTCFVPNTLISMWNGDFKPISDIRIGDEILDAYGEKQYVEFVHVKKVNEKLLSIRHRGNGDKLICTRDHKVIPFTFSGSFNPEGIEAEQLSTSDYLAEPTWSHLPQDHKLTYDLAYMCNDLKHLKVEENYVKHYCGNPVTRKVEESFDLGKLIGYFLSEGSISEGGSIVFTFNAKEEKYAEEVQRLLNDIFGCQSKIIIEENKNVRRVICHSTVVSRFLLKLCFYKGDKRIIHKIMFRDQIRGILCGCTRGDGGFSSLLKKCVINMNRDNLIRDLYILSLSLKAFCTISKTTEKKDGRIIKSLIFQSDAYNEIVDICEMNLEKYIKTSGKRRDRKESKNRIISKITEIKDVNYNGDVYDLQVSGSHTYVANFVCVHNCMYCGNQPGTEELTIDHILPKSMGGKTSWENCVLACVKCNSYKANRTPEQARMKFYRPDYKPFKPKFNLFKGDVRVKSWEAFLGEMYWNIPLEQ